ncbi:MAG: hypothetical protein ABI604_14095 [Nitrospirota bacterium]
MTRAKILQEVRPMRVEALYARRPRRDVTRAAAAELLGGTERTVRRGRERDDTEGGRVPPGVNSGRHE